MIGSIATCLNRVPTTKAERPRVGGAKKADKASFETIGESLEPTLDDLLSEEIIAAVMRADGVDPAALKAAILRQAGLQRLSSGEFERLQAIAAPAPHLWHLPQQGSDGVPHEDKQGEGGR